MTQNTLLVGAVALLIGIGLGASGAYYVMSVQSSAQFADAIVEPNNTIAAGPVAAISATSITITKQDGSTPSFKISADTSVVLGQEGQSAAPATWEAIQDGTVVLITPSAGDSKTAQTIVIVPAPAVQ